MTLIWELLESAERQHDSKSCRIAQYWLQYGLYTFFHKESTAEWLVSVAEIDGLLLGHLTEQTAFQLIKLRLQVKQSIFSELKYEFKNWI